MKIAFSTHGVRTAADAGVIARLSQPSADDLATALTVLAHVPTLGGVLTLRSLTLNRLPGGGDFYFGTQEAGVTFHPVDTRGRAVALGHTLEDLMTVTGVTITNIGLSPRREAWTA